LIYTAEDRIQLQACVGMVMKRQMPLKTGNFLSSRKTVKLLEELMRGFIKKRCKTKPRMFASDAGISHT